MDMYGYSIGTYMCALCVQCLRQKREMKPLKLELQRVDHRAVSWLLNGTSLLNNTSPVTAKAQRTLQKRRQKDCNRWRAGRSAIQYCLLEITWLWDPWTHRRRDCVPKKCTRSNQLKFVHTWGGALKAPPFTEELLAVNSYPREGEASFFEGVVTERLSTLQWMVLYPCTYGQ